MKIDLVNTPIEIQRIENLKDLTCIVIDVLRASSTIIYAFNGYDNLDKTRLKGVKEIIPAEDIDFAIDIYNHLNNEDYLLAGEKEAIKPRSFHLGNSPSEYKINAITKKMIIMATTNGTRTINLLTDSEDIYVGSFLNAFSIAKKCIDKKKDILIACAGTNNNPSLEDITCGGLIANYIIDLAKDKSIKYQVTDSVLTSIKTYKSFNSVLKILQTAEHGKRLISKGFEKDLVDCSQKNKFNIVPQYFEGKLLPLSMPTFSFCGNIN